MKKIHYFICINLLLISFHAYSSKTSEFLNIPIYQFSVESGIPCIFGKKSNSPMIAWRLFVKAGSFSEHQYQNSGISHLLEHLCFKGSENHKETEISREVSALGGNLNAYTTLDQTVYEINLPKDHASKALTLMRDLVFYLSENEDELIREKDVVLREMDMNDDEPKTHSFNILMQALYPNSPVQYPVIGQRRILNNLTFKDIKNYHTQFYVPSNMVLVGVGDIENFEAMADETRRVFNDLPTRESGIPAFQTVTAEAPFKKTVHTSHPQRVMPNLLLGWKTIPMSHIDSPALDIIACILDRHLEELKSELNGKNLSFGASSYHYSPAFPGFFSINADFEKVPVSYIKSRITDILSDLAAGKLHKNELERAKTTIYSLLLQTLQSNKDLAEWLGNSYLLEKDIYAFDRWYERIKNVTKKDVSACVDKYLSEINCITVISEAEHDSPEQMPASTVDETHANYTLVDISPSFQILAWPDNSVPLVYFTWLFPRGVIHESGDHLPFMDLLTDVWGKATHKYHAGEITDMWTAFGGSVSSYHSNHCIGLQAFGLSQHFKPMLNSLTTLVFKPDFESTDINVARQETKLAYEQELKDPVGRAFMETRELLFPGHPLGNKIPRQIDASMNTTKDQILAYHNGIVTGDKTILSVTGDFKMEELNDWITTLQKSNVIPRHEPAELMLPPPTDNVVMPGVIHPINIPKATQVFVVLGWKLHVTDKTEKLYFEVLESFLSAQSSPLFIELREKKGLAYRIGAHFESFLHLPGIFALYAGTDSEDNAMVIRNAMYDELSHFAKGSFTEEMFQTAKQIYKGSLYEFYESPSNLAPSLTTIHLYGEDPDYILDRFKKIDSLNYPTLITLLNRHLMQSPFVTVVTGKGLGDHGS